jgi:hypothetical protein
MSLLKFELKQSHLDLLKNVQWNLDDTCRFIVSYQNLDVESTDPFYLPDVSPFRGDDVYSDMDLILNGRPEEFDPSNKHDAPVFTDEKIKDFDTLLSELPRALEIILSTQSFEVGKYKCRSYLKDWKKAD